jgi:intracellular proteinase inhibitor BsuPI
MNLHTIARRILLSVSAIALCVIVVASGCDDGVSPPIGDPVYTMEFPSQEFTSLGQGFEVSFRVDSTRYHENGLMTLHLTVRNTSPLAIEFNYSGGARYDFAVKDSTGAAIWRWSEGKSFGGVGQDIVAPGDSLVVAEQDWDLRDRDGQLLPVDKSFSIVAETLAYGRPPYLTYPHLEFTTRMAL